MSNRRRLQGTFALGGTVAAILAACGETNRPEERQTLAEPTFRAVGALASDDGQCSIVAEKPVLWLPLSGVDAAQRTREVVTGFDGDVVARGTPSFVDGPVGAHLAFDGETHITVEAADRLDPASDGFTIAAWVSPDHDMAGTIAARGFWDAPGSWRLRATDRSTLRFELCDLDGCFAHDLREGLSAGGWSYVSASARVVDDGEGRSVEVTLKSQPSGAPALSWTGTSRVLAHFSFDVPGLLSIGAGLVPAPVTPEFDAPEITTSAVDAFRGGIDEVMLFAGQLGEGVFAALAGAPSGGVCEECIRDVTPPVITCPGSIGVEVGTPIVPADATATDNCDPHPTLLMAVSAPVPSKPGEVTTVTYTAIDSSGNQASCTSEVIAEDPPSYPPAEKTELTGGSCTLGISPARVTTGATVTLRVDNLSYQCANGWCDISQRFYITEPGVGGNPSNRYVGQSWLTSLGTHNGPGGSADADVRNLELLRSSLAVATVNVTARDSATHELLKTWSCTATVIVDPELDAYCGRPIAYWDAAVQSGQAVFHVLDPQVWNDGAGWYDGTDQADLILGNHYNNKIHGRGGNDCIVGFGGADRIHGDDGADRLDGGSFGDEMWGDSGNDTLWGGSAIDILHGNGEPDAIYGGDGGDLIYADDGDDMVWGGPGNDIIEGGSGRDVLDGGIGNDRIKGQGDGDSLLGKNGCDTMEGGDGDDWIAGDNGSDRAWGNGDRDTLLGGAERDFLRGDANDDTIDGEAGDDKICGDAGADTLTGSGGIDECRGGSGADSISCDNPNGPECNWSNWGSWGLYPCD